MKTVNLSFVPCVFCSYPSALAQTAEVTAKPLSDSDISTASLRCAGGETRHHYTYHGV